MGFSSSKKSKKVIINKESLCPMLIEFLCCKCGEIPEVLNVHLDNSKIELNCRKCGIYEILIDEYYDTLSKTNYFKKCSNCKKEGLNIKFFFCFNCQNIICESCKNKKHSDHFFIEEKEKKRICLRHNKEFKYYCFDCQENFCEEEKEEEHKKHEIKEILDLAHSLIDNKKTIKEINKELNNLVEFNETILKYSENLKYKECYLKSIINMGKSIEEGNKRNSKDIKCLLSGLSKGIEKSIKSIDALGIDKGIHLQRNEKYLHLNNRELDDQDFKYISQIRFNQLKEIDISENNITNVEPFKKMNLPFLEFLNLSYNKINKIEPVTKLKSYKLQYIFLQRNNIEDLETFLESDFPYLKILRVEDNNINEENEKIKETLNKMNKKYPGRFIYNPIEEQIKEFKDKYGIEISGDSEDIELCDLEGGDEMLKDLFLIITYKPKNKIKKLILRNIDIKDPSMLNKIKFNELELLDLSVNEIKDFEFLSNMKSKNLKYLYLDRNKFNDISPILRADLPNLEIISLNSEFFEDDITSKFIELENKINKDEDRIIVQLQKPLKDQFLSKVEKSLKEERLISNKVSFLCPECGLLPPEISNINVNNKHIEFKCKKCGIKEYNSKYIFKEIDKNNNIINYYIQDYNHKDKIWLKEYVNQKNKSTINKNSLTFDNNEKQFNIYKKIINKKDEQIKQIIKLNDIIIESCEKYQNNYFYLKSLNNISTSLRKEKYWDSNDLKFLFTSFYNEIEYSGFAIYKLYDEKNIKIKREEEDLILSNKKLNDENIKCISLIKFNQLKKIDLSENEITNIEPLCNMILPFLESLNLSYNKIKNIVPLSEINSRILKYLFIQNNQIEDIQVFLDPDFPKLEILRLENNNINENSDSIKLLELYNKTNNILVTNKKIDEIEKKYNIKYNEEKIEVEGTEEGDSMLRNLSIILSQKNKNKMRYLNLKGNKIENPSILNRIHFNCHFLEEFDLSKNNIKNLQFLNEMEAKNLKRLYLSSNYINDLSPLNNIKEYFPHLELIALNNNNFNPEDSKYTDLFKTLMEHGIEIITKSN